MAGAVKRLHMGGCGRQDGGGVRVGIQAYPERREVGGWDRAKWFAAGSRVPEDSAETERAEIERSTPEAVQPCIAVAGVAPRGGTGRRQLLASGSDATAR